MYPPWLDRHCGGQPSNRYSGLVADTKVDDVCQQDHATATNLGQTHKADFDLSSLFYWCREGGSNPHEVALGGF